jgi:hypothetical protein
MADGHLMARCRRQTAAATKMAEYQKDGKI